MDQVKTEKIDLQILCRLPYHKKYVAMIRGSHHQLSTNADCCFRKVYYMYSEVCFRNDLQK